jgi:hypothetical protein
MEYLDLLPDENDLKGKTIEEQNKILEDTLQLFIDNVELNALHRSHRDPEGVGLRELLKKNPQWEIELTTRPVKMFFSKWAKEIDEAVGYQRAEKIETVISIYEGLLVNECINKAAEYLRLKQIPEVKKCIAHFKMLLETHHIDESGLKITHHEHTTMQDYTFLNATDYTAIAKKYLLLIPEVRFNYLESIRKKYYKDNNNMFELMANEIRKVKDSHASFIIDRLDRLQLANPELDWSIEFERMKHNYWMAPIHGGHNLDSLESLETNLRQYIELIKTGEMIEANRIDMLNMRSRGYRAMNPISAIGRVEDAINQAKGELGKAQFAKSESVEIWQGEVTFWESELVFHKKRAMERVKSDHPSAITEIPKPRAKHYVLAYLFECHATGIQPIKFGKTDLEKKGVEIMGQGRGNTFYKAFNEINGIDINSEKDLVVKGGNDWRKIVLSITNSPDAVNEYLISKKL